MVRNALNPTPSEMTEFDIEAFTTQWLQDQSLESCPEDRKPELQAAIAEEAVKSDSPYLKKKMEEAPKQPDGNGSGKDGGADPG